MTDDAGVADPQLPILVKVSSLLEVMRLGWSYERLENLWAHSSLTAHWVNIEVCYSSNEILVSIRILSVSYTYGVPESYVFFHISITDVLFAVNFAEENVPKDLDTGCSVGEVV